MVTTNEDELQVLREIDVLAEGLATMAQRAPRITRALIQGIRDLTGRSEALEAASQEAQLRALLAELEPSTPPPAQDRELLRLKCLEMIRQLTGTLRSLAQLAPQAVAEVLPRLSEAVDAATKAAAAQVEDPMVAAMLRHAVEPPKVSS